MQINSRRMSSVVLFIAVVVSLHAPGQTHSQQSGENQTPEEAIQFNFKGATFEQVIDFFSRVTGLPVVWKTDPPEGTLDYLSARWYDLPEALQTLNVILQAKGVTVSVKDDMLYVQRLEAMQKEDLPTFVGILPDEVAPDEIITIVRQLRHASAGQFSDRLSTMIAEYGDVIAIEEQNALILTDRASNIRRLLTIINELDREVSEEPSRVVDVPERIVRSISLNHVEPTMILEALNELLTQRQSTMVSMAAGLDGNSIVVTGHREDNELVSKLVALLDQKSKEDKAVQLIRIQRGDTSRIVREAKSLFRKVSDEESSEKVLSIDHDKQSRVVTLIGSSPAIRRFTEILTEVERHFIIERETRRFTTRHRRPTEISENVITLVHAVLNPSEDTAFISPTILPMDSLNSLIAIASPDQFDAIEVAVRELDSEKMIAEGELRVLKLKNAKAEAIRDILEGVTSSQLEDNESTYVPGIHEHIRRMRTRDEQGNVTGSAIDVTVPIKVIADPQLNIVTVGSSAENLDAIEELVATLDQLPITDAISVRLFPLDNISAADFGRIIRELFSKGRQLGKTAVGIPEGVTGKALLGSVAIAIDERTNTAIVAGTEDSIALIDVLSQRIDSDVAVGWMEPRIIPLRYAEADDLAVALNAILVEGSDDLPQSSPLKRQLARLRLARVKTGKATVMESDIFVPMTHLLIRSYSQMNALILVGTPENLDLVAELIAMMDVESASPISSVRIYPIEHASAVKLALVIRELFDQQTRTGVLKSEDRAVIQTDERTNAIIAVTSERSFAVIESLIAKLDSEGVRAESQVKVIPVTHGNVEHVANAVSRILDHQHTALPDEESQIQKPLILTDQRTNSILVAANPDDVDAIEALVKQLSIAPISPAVDIHVIPIPESIDGEELAVRLQRVMRQRLESLGDLTSPSDRVRIETDPSGNSLIVAANSENTETIKSLVALLTKHDAERKADEPVAELTQSLDREMDIIVLNSSRAEELVHILSELYVDERNRFYDQNEIQVAAYERLNAILVNAPHDDVVSIRELIEHLDVESHVPVVEIKYVPLRSAKANDIVELFESILDGRGPGTHESSKRETVLTYLRKLAHQQKHEGTNGVHMKLSDAIRESISLASDVRTNTIIVTAPRDSMQMIEQMIQDLDVTESEARSFRIFKLANANAPAMSEIIAEVFPTSRNVDGSDDTQWSVTVTVDSRTNSLIVSGTPTDIDLVAQIVDELDNVEAAEREVFVFQLRNTVADDVARVVGDFIEQEQQKLIRSHGNEKTSLAHRLLEREVTIRGDAKSNAVLVSTSPRYMDRIKALIRELDIDPPKVFIEVMLAEVTLSRSFASARAIVGKDDESSDAVESFVRGLGVPNHTIASADFKLLLDSLKSQGRLHVLSSPSIMVANNEQAHIQIGETLHLPGEIDREGSSVVKEELGVMLTVTPSINPDGFVRLKVQPELSSVSERSSPITEHLDLPIILRRRAETTVTVQDGQTIVLGGLIAKSEDAPRNRSRKRAVTELLVALTPRVIASPSGVTHE